MGFGNIFMSWRQPASMAKCLASLAKTSNPKKIRRLANRSDHEQVHLEAARRLQDGQWLSRLARKAVLVPVRLQAACLIGDQAALAAIALAEWEIQRGCAAVHHISNEILLRRIARAARQDAIRLAAALRLRNPRLLRQLARSVTDIQVRWKIALELDDPYQMADIAMFKPSSEYMDILRRKARRALSNHLNRHEVNQKSHALLCFMYSVPYPLFKLEAFVRLPLREVSPERLQYLAGIDLRYSPPLLLKLLILRIKASGWHVTQSQSKLDCTSCRGKGEFLLNCVAGDQEPVLGESFPCPDCKGAGRVPVTALTCSHESHRDVAFHLPVGSFHFQSLNDCHDLRGA